MENVWCKLVELEYARLQLFATSIAQQMVQNQKIFESGTVDTVHVPLSPYRMLFLTNILYITCHILTGLLIPYSNCTPRFIESSMNPGLGISIHTYVFYRFIFYVLVRHCRGFPA